MKQFFTTILLGISFFQAYSQNVGIGTATPNPNAQLDITSDSKGILIPRLTTGQRLGITTPAKGLFLYDSTLSSFFYHNGLSWQELPTANNIWKLDGNSGTNPSSQFIGTTDLAPLQFRINNVKAGYVDSATFNTSFGFRTFNSITSGKHNTAFGYRAMYNNTSGSSNVAIGDSALHNNQTSSDNTVIGARAGRNLNSNGNSIFGKDAGYSVISGSGHSFFGNKAGYSTTVNTYNSFFGSLTGYALSTGGANAFFGTGAGQNQLSGSYNCYFGQAAGYNRPSGDASSFFGTFAGSNDASVFPNILIGYESGFNNGGNFNTLIGNGSGYNNLGNFNSLIGFYAGYNNTGHYNSSLGYNTLLSNTSGTFNSAIGYGSDVIFSNLSNTTAIGANAKVGTSNAISLGDSTQNTTVGIGTAYPTKAGLVVNQTVGGYVHAMFGSNTTGVAIESNWPGIGMNCYYNGGRRYIANGYAANINVDPGSGALYIMMNANGTKDNLVTTSKGILFLNGAGSTGAFVPSSDNVYTLGSSVNRWTTIYATNNIINTSDAREKKNIQPLQYGMQQIMQLKPVSFQWRKQEAGTQTMLGLVAQDVQKIIPELVVDNNNKLGMRSAEIIPVLIKGMQEQQATIEKMDRRIQLLEEQNKMLLKVIDKITDNKSASTIMAQQ